jgi:hypothetical protein
MSLRFSRRTFLAGLAAGIVGAAIGLRRYWSGGGAGRDAALRLAGVLRHPDGAALLGRLYLAGHPQEADAARLATLIAAALDPALTPVSAATDTALRAGLEERIRTDFTRGEMVAVGGWLLSVTEARLCALVSLLRDTKAGAGA